MFLNFLIKKENERGKTASENFLDLKCRSWIWNWNPRHFLCIIINRPLGYCLEYISSHEWCKTCLLHAIIIMTRLFSENLRTHMWLHGWITLTMHNVCQIYRQQFTVVFQLRIDWNLSSGLLIKYVFFSGLSE